MGNVDYITPEAKIQAKVARLQARVARRIEAENANKPDAHVEFLMALAGAFHSGEQDGK